MKTLLTALVAAAVSAAAPALAQAPAAAPAPAPAYGPAISAAQARKVVDAGAAEAQRRGFAMAFAIVEPSGALVSFHRMDGTQYGSTEVAQGKARTSAHFRRPTKAFSESVARNPAFLSLGVVAVDGGLPILDGGRIVGALGVSGGTPQQDEEIAQAALAAAR